jgi:ferredoxin
MMGDELSTVPFALPSTFTKGSREWAISRMAMKLIFGSARAQPRVRNAACKRCGLCVDACPVDAIERRGEELSPRIKDELCIQCFCCHEVCPHKAISTRSSLGMKIWRMIDRRRIAKSVKM